MKETCQDEGGVPDQSCADHAVVGVTWYGANLFCTLTGGRRLCTEAEWERAAKGPQHRIWPWGSDLPADLLEEKANGSSLSSTDAFKWTSPVGMFTDGATACAEGESPCGVLDLAGNVWEWVSDWYSPTCYQGGEEWVDPQGPSEEDSTKAKVIRGGSYATPFGGSSWAVHGYDLRVSGRLGMPPGFAEDPTVDPARWGLDVGFRCCADEE
jgi:formylglycine-generating enzyme required for sulfatase activity